MDDDVNFFSRIQQRLIALVGGHKIVTFVSMIVSMILVTGFVQMLPKQSPTVSPKLTALPKPTADLTQTEEATVSSLIHRPDFETDVLGDSNESESDDLVSFTSYPTLPPLVVPTLVPIPSYIPPVPSPYPTAVFAAAPSCSGIPTAYNSQAYVSANTSLVNSQVTISVELLDCNNVLAAVNDSLTVALVNADPATTINGGSAPVTVQAQNGKATFAINSSHAVTDTFIITNTTRSFSVTDPHNKNPTISFVNNTGGSSNCTTPGGIPNSWFSDVYPASPVTVLLGSSVTFIVKIRDCNRNAITTNDVVRISLSSGDTTTQVNGNNFPYSVTSVNGQVSFTIISQRAGANNFIITDTTSSFTITDTNNRNPSVTFTSPATPAPVFSTATPQPTVSPSQVPTIVPTNTPPAATSTSAPQATSTPANTGPSPL